MASEPSIIEEFQASIKVMLLTNQLRKALCRVAELTVERDAAFNLIQTQQETIAKLGRERL